MLIEKYSKGKKKQQLECLPAEDNSTPGFSEKQKSAELQYCHLEVNVGVFYIFKEQKIHIKICAFIFK